MNEFSVIITAGGIGKRMGSHIPKQFIEISGKPVLIHTLERFYNFDPNAELIITLPEEWFHFWNELVEVYKCTIPHKVVEGGGERYHSVKNALAVCKGKYIAVHDGVRPLVSDETLKNCFDNVKQHKAVVPVIRLKESLRKITLEESHSVDRTEYRLVQTPQYFERETLLNAYTIPFHSGITDDASLVEESGVKIFLTDGNEENIKITTQADIIIAEAFLKVKS